MLRVILLFFFRCMYCSNALCTAAIVAEAAAAVECFIFNLPGLFFLFFSSSVIINDNDDVRNIWFLYTRTTSFEQHIFLRFVLKNTEIRCCYCSFNLILCVFASFFVVVVVLVSNFGLNRIDRIKQPL